MRLSTVKGEPGFILWEELLRSGTDIEVFLDGIKQEWVDMADDQQGVIRRAVLDANGELQIDPDNPDRVYTELVTGKVRIILNGEDH